MTKEESVPAGYEQAISLKIYEGELVWSRSQAMLVINTILIATIGVFLNTTTPNDTVLITLAVCGFLFCIVWLESSIRGFAFNKFWSYSARDLEEQSKSVKLLTRGAKFKNNEVVEFKFKGSDGLRFRYQRPWLGRFLKTDIGTYILITIFIFLYLVIGTLAVYHNTNIIRVQYCSSQDLKK